LLLLAGISLFWGINWPAMKVAMADIEPWTFRTLCLVIGSAGLFALGRIRGNRLSVPRADLGPLVLVALLNVAGWQLCSAFALTYLPAGRAAIIGFTMPIWASLLGVKFLGERMTGLRIAGLVFGIAGLVVLLAPDLERLVAAPGGVLLILAASVCWAGGTVSMKRVRWHMDVVPLAAWQLGIGSLPAILGMVVLGRPGTIVSAGWESALATAYICLIPMVWCHYAWFRVLALFPAGLASIGTLAVPVVGVFSSALMLGETVGASEILALGLVVAGLFLVMVLPGLTARHGSRAGSQDG
jgi:drug/metabolite transporter (DMT)-like permease